MKLASLAAAVSVDLLEKIPQQWAGIVVIAGAMTVGAGGGVTTVVVLGEFQALPDRVAQLEDWRYAHTDTVAAPGIRRITTLEREQRQLTDQMDRVETMVYRLYCGQYPNECQRIPRDGGSGP